MKPLFVLAAALLVTGSAAFAQQGNPGAHFVENWDLDGNGTVTIEEISEKRGDVFVAFDADENGVLSAEEYALFDEARANDMAQFGGGHGKGMMAMEAPMERGFNDADGDGLVSASEFAAAGPMMFAQMDKNGDGAVSTDDFGMNN
jgi:uncharacterized protein (DUF2141 family)